MTTIEQRPISKATGVGDSQKQKQQFHHLMVFDTWTGKGSDDSGKGSDDSGKDSDDSGKGSDDSGKGSDDSGKDSDDLYTT